MIHPLKLAIVTAVLVLAGNCVARAQEPKAEKPPQDPTEWTDIRVLGIEGQGWKDTKAPFDRLPAKAEGVVRPPVWGLSHHSAGLCVRFATAAGEIKSRWTLINKDLAMAHMPATGVSGLDLYVRQADGAWRWLAAGRPAQPTNTATLVSGLAAEPREYLLYLPLYNGVTSVELGVGAGQALTKAPARPEKQAKPIVFYGTSITQGGCASRPGMVHTAIIGRHLDMPVINLGFSGNGKMEPEMAALLAELDPAAYVLDCLPNMNAALVAERVEPFVKTLRQAHPTTPIVLVEDRDYPDGFLLKGKRQTNDANHAALRKAYDNLRSAGIGDLHYVPGDGLVGDDGEGTVDGSHPTDLGFVRQAEAFERVLKPLLKP